MRSEMEKDILKVLVTEEELHARIAEMGETLYEQFQNKNPLFLSVLKGSFVFMADLVRACQVKSDVEFIAVSSYQNATTSSGRVQITHDLQQDITGRHLIIVEDILDSGNTLAFLKEYFMTKGAASITIVTLLDKPSRRTKAITADLAGFTVPDEFVVGYAWTTASCTATFPTSVSSSRRSTRTTETAGGRKPPLRWGRAYHECPGWASKEVLNL